MTYHNKKNILLLLSFYLALAPSVWFASFKLGPIKDTLMVLISLLSVSFFLPPPKKAVMTFVLTLSFLGVSFSLNPTKSDVSVLVFGIIEDFILFVIGYNIFRNIETLEKYISIALILPVIGCCIALLNYLTGFPNWIAPDQLANYELKGQFGYEIYPLWSTGFSWSRNGWGCTLAVLLPLCFLLPRKSQHALIFYLIILLSIFVCGNRNGLLASVIALFILILKSKRIQPSIVNLRPLVIFLVIGLLLFGSSFIISTLRLDSGDLSAGRMLQYVLIPDMLREMGFWGLGHNGTVSFLSDQGLGEHALHITYLKIIIEYGWIIGIIMIAVVIDVIKKIRKALSSNNKNQVIAALVLTVGLLLGLFEPMTIFGVYGGYSIWWLAYGYLTFVLQNGKEIQGKCYYPNLQKAG